MSNTIPIIIWCQWRRSSTAEKIVPAPLFGEDDLLHDTHSRYVFPTPIAADGCQLVFHQRFVQVVHIRVQRDEPQGCCQAECLRPLGGANSSGTRALKLPERYLYMHERKKSEVNKTYVDSIQDQRHEYTLKN